ncbi:hypothetical protein ANT_27270 [Candidatus Vecturithrix granuli]|uniref:D-serine dehydratase-like domain-containing protein n=1 Tax=Vecturithrix granuli TaxID=1499967 RepID=A0A081BW36_VECG1|nr:hypothetical protein ANT_27270 [Candidatus Vecturithrix granuli]
MLNNIVKPTLLLNKARAIHNIETMISKAARSGVRFRPHFKTHQSAAIGDWFQERGVAAITVSSVDMARYFANHGWQDITIAFPVNVREIDKINALAKTITLNLLAESEESVHFLGSRLMHPAKLWIKIDTGYHRTGLSWDHGEKIAALAGTIAQEKRLTFQGLLTHSGHSYRARSQQQVREIYADTIAKMQATREGLRQAGFTGVEISIGDTPSCSIVENFSGVDEIRPGNFVFYDATQLAIGSCLVGQIAVAVACPVVAKHQERQELIIYGGAVHLSKDVLVQSFEPWGEKPTYGAIALPEGSGWGPILSNAYVAGISQEHGVVKVLQEDFDRINVGDLLMVIPVHSCLTAHLLRKYVTLEGEVLELANLS